LGLKVGTHAAVSEALVNRYTGYGYYCRVVVTVLLGIYLCKDLKINKNCSVADPDLPDPHVVGPPESFYHQAKLVRKTLIPTIL
jgi:hypothetical protein